MGLFSFLFGRRKRKDGSYIQKTYRYQSQAGSVRQSTRFSLASFFRKNRTNEVQVKSNPTMIEYAKGDEKKLISLPKNVTFLGLPSHAQYKEESIDDEKTQVEIPRNTGRGNKGISNAVTSRSTDWFPRKELQKPVTSLNQFYRDTTDSRQDTKKARGRQPESTGKKFGSFEKRKSLYEKSSGMVSDENNFSMSSGLNLDRNGAVRGDEILKLVEIIKDYGEFNRKRGCVTLTFGELARVYSGSASFLVLLLKTAKSQNLVFYNGPDTLRVGDDDRVIIEIRN